MTAVPVVGAVVVDPQPDAGANARVAATTRGINRRGVGIRNLGMGGGYPPQVPSWRLAEGVLFDKDGRGGVWMMRRRCARA